jgi:phosphocarrier protein HPr
LFVGGRKGGMERHEQTLKVVNPLGLHARAAAQLVKLTARMRCDVLLESEGQNVNGKSIMGVLTLAAAQGSDVTVTCSGEQAAESLAQIAQLFALGFHELSP